MAAGRHRPHRGSGAPITTRQPKPPQRTTSVLCTVLDNKPASVKRPTRRLQGRVRLATRKRQATHRAHPIGGIRSLPATHARSPRPLALPGLTLPAAARAGYALVSWRERSLRLIAISDVDRSDLLELARLHAEAAAASAGR